MPDRFPLDPRAPASPLPQWSDEEMGLALAWLLLFHDGESKPLPNERWSLVAIDALRACGAKELDYSGDDDDNQDESGQEVALREAARYEPTHWLRGNTLLNYGGPNAVLENDGWLPLYRRVTEAGEG